MPTIESTPRAAVMPGSYLTDGRRLFRVVSLFDSPLAPLAELEDCRTLEIACCSPADLRRMGLRRVLLGGAPPMEARSR